MIYWNPDPEIFSLTIGSIGPIAPRWYGLSFVLGFWLGEKYVGARMLRNGYTKKDVASLFTHMLLGTIIGSRLGHCLFYEPMEYLTDPLRILYIWEGGLASHGGFLGVILAVLLFHKRVKPIDYLWLMDVTAAPIIFTGGLIRLGNLMNSEILGKATDLPWAFVFKKVDLIARHPAQLYESIGYLSISAVSAYLFKHFNKDWIKGRIFGLTLALGFIHRFFVEFSKENQVSFENGMFMNMGQALSIPMILVGLYFFFRDRLSGK